MASSCYQHLCPDCLTQREPKYPSIHYSQLQVPEAHEGYEFPQSEATLSSHPTMESSGLKDSYGISPVSAQPQSLKRRVVQEEPPAEAFIQFSIVFNSEKDVLKVTLQEAPNFGTKYSYGRYSVSSYLYPASKGQQEFVSRIECYSPNPGIDKEFEFNGWSESNKKTLILAVYKHTRCIKRNMIGVVPVDLNSVDLSGKTIQQKIQDSPDDIKRYGNSSIPMTRSDSCACHPEAETDASNKKAVTKLIIASIISLLFTISEVLGGYFAGSLAIMTDAAHMLSDLAGFLISLFAIWVGSRPPSKGMSFGWHRAEVIGAIISVLIVWVLTGVLFYEAVQRVINPDLIDVKPDIMLIIACIGVFVNVFMCAVLGHGHGHSHGGGGHGHAHGGGHDKKKQESSASPEENNSRLGRLKRRLRKKKKQENTENINVRAAFVHVIGDLIQSIGVVIAGYIIWIRPDWKLADPVVTFVFCILVLFSTINVLKDALRVLMEGTPSHIDHEDVKDDLEEIAGVKQAHSLHIWSLTTTRTALAAHLTIEPGINAQDVLNKASRMLKENHAITKTTLQVEDYNELMDDCDVCQERQPPSSSCCVM